jgi:hypothetical protein
VVDIGYSTDLVGALPGVMDRALTNFSCPFRTHRESLAAFARAIYGLRMEGGRCAEPGRPAGCGLYDPHAQYQVPPVREVAFTGGDQVIQGEIGASFGIDLIDVVLDSPAAGQPLTLEFRGAPGSVAEFSVQIVRPTDSGGDAGPPRVSAGELRARSHPDGLRLTIIPAIDTSACNRLGLIVTRLDAREASDPLGEYTFLLRSGVGGDGVSEST